MPIYEYRCPLCQKSITEKRSIHDDTPTHMCTNCGVEMHSIVENLGVSFKGSGWGSSR
jgi:putative FmdB family regulatory protein